VEDGAMRGALARRYEPQLQPHRAPALLQAQRQVHLGLEQREALHLQLQRGVNLRQPHPARADGLVDARGKRPDLLAHHGQQALARGRVEGGVVEQIDGSLDAAHRAAAALGQAVQKPVSLAVVGELAGDVVG
jgi:hypothetical protein